jgi:Family of unknown function (DUF6521)
VIATTAWQERSSEEANLFNPAFLATLIDSTAGGYRELSASALPWPLIFLALPAVLHKRTRESLPRDVRGSMAGWVRSHPLEVREIAERAPSVRQTISEAVVFGLAHGTIVRDGAGLLPGRRARRRPGEPRREPTEDFASCATRARFFGRWCAVSGSTATVFALWGLRP